MSDIQARLRFDITQFQNALNQVRGEIKELRASAKSQGRGLGDSMFGPMKTAIAGLGLAKLGSEIFDAVLRFDTLEKTLRTTEGSAEGAARRFAELREVGRNPGLSLEAAVQGDVRLRAVGLSAEQSTRILLEMGNALALVGGSGEDLQGVLLAMTQISAKGKVFAEEINQINERLPQVRTVMKNVFGTSVSEDIQKMGLEANDFIMRLTDGFSELERAAPGMREDLTELGTIFNTLANEAFSPLLHEIIPGFRDLATHLAENKQLFADFGSTGVGVMKALGQLTTGAAEAVGLAVQFGSEYAATGSIEKAKQHVSGIVDMQRQAREEGESSATQTSSRHGAASGSKSAGAGGIPSLGGQSGEHIWDDAAKQVKLLEKIADIKKRTAQDGLSIQDKVQAKQQEINEAQEEENALALDGEYGEEAKLEVELKRLTLQRELNQLLEQQTREIHEAAQEIDHEVEAKRKLAIETAKTAMAQKKQRDTVRNDAMMTLEVLRLRAHGQDDKADKIEREARIRDRKAELRGLGASPEAAASQAREEEDRRDQMERRQNGQRGHIYGRRGPGKRMGSAGGGGLAQFHKMQNEDYFMTGMADQKPLPPGQREYFFANEGGSLADRATRAAGKQDAGESNDTTQEDLLRKLISVTGTGLGVSQ